MYNDYSYIITVPKRNNKKIIIISIVVIIILIIIGLSIFGGIKYAQYQEEQRIVEEQARIEKERIEEEKRQEEIRRQEEEKRRKYYEPLTENQLQAVENIYESDEKRVFLTFDDGPSTTVTPLILDLLKQQNIKATFFVLGSRVSANQDLVKREYNEGHYIANHGYSHVYSQIYESPESVLSEYYITNECIQDALGTTEYNSRIFRFPGGSIGGYYSEIKDEAWQVLRDNQIASVDWNALTRDAEGAHTVESIMENLEETVGEKQSVVLLMHDAYDKVLTYETLPQVIQFFKDRGYAFKNMYDIL